MGENTKKGKITQSIRIYIPHEIHSHYETERHTARPARLLDENLELWKKSLENMLQIFDHKDSPFNHIETHYSAIHILESKESHRKWIYSQSNPIAIAEDKGLIKKTEEILDIHCADLLLTEIEHHSKNEYSDIEETIHDFNKFQNNPIIQDIGNIIKYLTEEEVPFFIILDDVIEDESEYTRSTGHEIVTDQSFVYGRKGCQCLMENFQKESKIKGITSISGCHDDHKYSQFIADEAIRNLYATIKNKLRG